MAIPSPTATVSGTAAESSNSAVSWGAVLGGAVVASAVTVMVTALGAGIGLSAVSPFGANPSPTMFGFWAAVWVMLVQWLSSAFGGYVAGRMRTKWTGLHTDEVFFRDTAHGFITWAVSSLVVVGLLGAATAGLVGGVGHAAAHGGASAVAGGDQGYVLDALLRPAQPTAAQPMNEVRGEAARILATAATGKVSDEDRAYLSAVVAQHAAVPLPDAQARVDAAIGKTASAADRAKQDADQARKASARFMFFSFAAMLIGAFTASVAAAIGGRQRDLH